MTQACSEKVAQASAWQESNCCYLFHTKEKDCLGGLFEADGRLASFKFHLSDA